MESGDHDKAVLDFARIVELGESAESVRLSYANALEKANDLPNAYHQARLAVEENSGSVDAHGCLGWYAFRVREFSESIKASRRALELDPQRLMPAFNLALAYLARGDQQQALGIYRRTIDDFKGHAPEEAARVLQDARGDLDLLPDAGESLAPFIANVREMIDTALRERVTAACGSAAVQQPKLSVQA